MAQRFPTASEVNASSLSEHACGPPVINDCLGFGD
jgi:hypothetical protein